MTTTLPTISFDTNSSVLTENNFGSQLITVTARLSSVSATEVTVPITYSGTATATDYTDRTNVITIAANSLIGSASFRVLGDYDLEQDETVILTMSNPTGADFGTYSVHTHTITNNDVAPTFYYSISSANTSLSEDWERLDFSVNATSTTAITSWPDLVIAVQGSALPSVFHDQYQKSFVEPLGGNAGAPESFKSHELPFTPDYRSSGTNLDDRVLEVNSSASTPGPEFLYHLNSFDKYDPSTATNHSHIQITKVNADTGALVSNFGTGGQLVLKSSSLLNASSSSPEVVTDSSGNLYVSGGAGSGAPAIQKYSSLGVLDSTFAVTNSSFTIATTNLLGVSNNQLYVISSEGNSSEGKLHAIDTASGTSTQVSAVSAIPFLQSTGNSTASSNPFVVLSETGTITWVTPSNAAVEPNTYKSYTISTGAVTSKTLDSSFSASERILSNKGELYVLNETLDKVSKFNSPSASAQSFVDLNLSTLSTLSKFPLPSTSASDWSFQGVGEDGSLYLKVNLSSGVANTPASAFVKLEPNSTNSGLVLDTAWGMNGFVYSNSNLIPIGMVGDNLVIANSKRDFDYDLQMQITTAQQSLPFIGQHGGESFFKIDFPTNAAGSSQNLVFNDLFIRSRADYLFEGAENIDIRLVPISEVHQKFGSNHVSNVYWIDPVTTKAQLSINLLDDTPLPTANVIDLGGWIGHASPFDYQSSGWTATGYQRDSHVRFWDAQINHTGGISELQISLDQADITKITTSHANSANPILTIGRQHHNQQTGEYVITGSPTPTQTKFDFDTLIDDATASKSFFLDTYNHLGDRVQFVVDLKSRTDPVINTKKFVDVIFRTADGSLMSKDEASSVLSQEFGIGFDHTGTTALLGFSEEINLDIQIKDAAGIPIQNGADATWGLRHDPLIPFSASFNGNVIQIQFDSSDPTYQDFHSLPNTLPWDGDEWDAWVGNPNASSFIVTVDNTPVTVTSAAMDGGLVLLTQHAISSSSIVKVSYTDPTPTTNSIKDVLQDENGTDVSSFTNFVATYRDIPIGLNVLSGAQFGWDSSLQHSEMDYFGGDYDLHVNVPAQEIVLEDSTKLKLVYRGATEFNPYFDGTNLASSNLIADYEYVTPQLSLVVNKSQYVALKGATAGLSILDIIEPSNGLSGTVLQWDAIMSNTANGSGLTFELANYSFPSGLGLYNLVSSTPVSSTMVFNGSAYADNLVGTFGAQTMYGFAGNDQFFGGPGDDLLYGGAGIDTVRYVGNRSDFTVVDLTNGNYSVTHNISMSQGGLNQSGFDRLSQIERIEFSDQVMQLNVPVDSMLDDVVFITATTKTIADDPNYVISPTTGVGGFDTLDLSYLSSTAPIDIQADYGYVTVTGTSSADFKQYNILDFDRFVINSAGGVNFRGSETSEVVQLKATSSNDIRLDNRDITDLAAETDLVDYSATSAAVTVDLSATTTVGSWVYATASKATTTATTDTISGAEGIIGSSGNDVITGNAGANLLVGGAGNDTLGGGAGNDVLIGGVGTGVGITDVLSGGTGKDILIDLDGATLKGSDTKKNQNANGDKDVFVVRTGATLENYHVARDGAGLAGRGPSSTNDTIVFNLSLVALTASLGDLATAMTGATTLNAAQLQVALADIKREIDIRVVPVAVDANDWEVIASYNGSWLASTQTTPVELARVRLKDMDLATGSELTDVTLANFSLENVIDPKIDRLVFNQVSDLLVEDEAINIGFVLEAVRAGTVRDEKPGGVMIGDFGKEERIFNPGVGDQKMFGSRGKDTYEFLVQELKTNGVPTQNAGNDRIVDTGGEDAVAFSNITLSQIAALDFEAVRFGREAGNFTLKSNYSQSEGATTNAGSFTWLGHFREGFDMGLEQIKLGDITLEMADVRYTAGSKTPSQVASGGLDTIMVGGAGMSGAISTFVVEDGVSRAAFDTARNLGGDTKQHLFLWDAEINDVIDLKDFITTKPTQTALENAVVKDGSSVAGKQSFNINLDATADFELMIHFMGSSMGTTVQESIVEAMITKAYA